MKIAFASTDNIHVNQHFGWCKEFYIYEILEDSFNFIKSIDSSIEISDEILVDQSQKGFCAGDSGGPLVLNQNNKNTAVGIVTHIFQNTQGEWSCKTKGAFTNITFFKDWVELTIKELSR